MRSAWAGRNKVGKIVFSDPVPVAAQQALVVKFAVGVTVGLVNRNGYWGENGVVVGLPIAPGGSCTVEFDTPLGKERKSFTEDELV